MPALEHIAQRLLALLALSALQALLLGTVAGLVIAIFPAQRAVVRARVWTLVLCATLLMPVLGAVMPAWRWTVPSFQSARQEWLSFAQAADRAPIVTAPSQTGIQPVSTRPPVTPAPSMVPNGATSIAPASSFTSIAREVFVWPMALAIYLIGVLFLSLRAAIGWQVTRRFMRVATPIDDAAVLERLRICALSAGLKESPRLLDTPTLAAPVTISVARPAIVLPATWRKWDVAVLNAVLAHEVAHVARRDALTQRLSLVYRAVYWFSPLSWWMHVHLGNLAEEASDEAALEAGADRTEYAETLLGFFVDVQGDSRRVQWQAIAMARGENAARRVERILKWEPKPLGFHRFSTVATIMLMAPALLATASIRPVVTQPPPNVQPPAIQLSRATAPAAVAPSAPVRVVKRTQVSPAVDHQDSGRMSERPTACGAIIDCRRIDSRELTWLNAYVGRPTYSVTQDEHYRRLLSLVSPDVLFHFHFDMPVSQALQGILGGPARPVEGHDERYVLLSACDDASCRAAVSFVWVDLQQGLAFSGIAFGPTNGEPSPTLTIFSAQVGDQITKLDQLPAAFRQDLDRWTTKAALPAVIARYFVNGIGDKSVLPHEEDDCGAPSGAAPYASPCKLVTLKVAEQDLAAVVYLLNRHFAEGTSSRLLIQASQIKWLESRENACAPLELPEALACRVTQTRARVRMLNRIGDVIGQLGKPDN